MARMKANGMRGVSFQTCRVREIVSNNRLIYQLYLPACLCVGLPVIVGILGVTPLQVSADD